MIEISVVIPTRNRAEYLNKALRSLEIQKIEQHRFEVITIDNGSRDNTKRIVEKYKNKIKNLRYIYEEKPGLHVGRNIGIKESKAPILTYADDDIEAFPSWLKAIRDSFEINGVYLVGGKILPKFKKTPPGWIVKQWKRDRLLGYLSIIDLGDEIKEINPNLIWGCNFSVRREILERLRGFHPDSMPNELIDYRGDGESYITRYCKEHDLKAIYNPEASVYHIIPDNRMTIEYFKKRAFRQGISDSFTELREKHLTQSKRRKQKRYKKIARRVIKFVRFIQRFFSDREIAKIEKNMVKEKKKGYSFHQKRIRLDRRLLDWVLKEEYR